MEGNLGGAWGSFWLVAYLVIAAAAVVQAVLLALQTWEHRRYVRSCLGNLHSRRAAGRVALIVPCKGVDVQLEGNLRALLCQDHGNYEVTFVVETADDAAAEVIRRVMAEHPQSAARLVIAGRAAHSGQKVHNLRAATANLSPQVEYLAFVDSDARPRPQWLRALAGRLREPGVGAVTGYRWFVPVRGSLASHLLYSGNCGVMSLLCRSSHYLVWGGSWGIRREVFDSIRLRKAWQRTLSDDLVAARQLRRAGLPVRFEPGCVVASPLDCSLREMFSFIRRQYLVGRFYAPAWWAMALLATTLINSTWLVSLALFLWSLARGSAFAWVPGGLCGMLYVLSVFRGAVRQDLVDSYFGDRRGVLRSARRFDTWVNPLAGLVCWLGMLGSLVGRYIRWRGISYQVALGGEIGAVLRDEPQVLPLVRGQPSPQPDAMPQQPYRKVG
jgi:ceramide glucosyltransferase